MLLSVVELPRRLTFDFRDVTEEGLAFDRVRGDFELRAGEVLATMDTNAALTLERIRQIAESTREQSAASNEIVSMVESIASGSSAIAQSAGRNAGQAQSLQRLSGELQSMLARFKV